MVTIGIEGKIKPLVQGEKIADFGDVDGTISVSQLPSDVMLDSEFTLSAIRGLLNLTVTEVNNLFTGASISNNILTFTQNDGTTVTITLPTGGMSVSDGVVTAGVFNADRTELTLTVDGATDVVIDIPELLRQGGILANLNEDGTLPAAADNQGKVIFSGNHVLISRDFGDHIKMVGIKNYGPTRVVDTGEPAISAQEMTYVGSYENIPPGNNYDLHAIAWDRGSGIWIRNNVGGGSSWSNLPSHLTPPPGYGYVYTDDDDAKDHVNNINQIGNVVIVGNYFTAKPKVITSFVPAETSDWQWTELGVTIADVGRLIQEHNVDVDAHDDIRSLISTAEDRLDALNGLEIEPYSSSATYSRGSANSIVTHSNSLFIYISGTERSSNHDPDTQPGYWLELSEGVTYTVLDNNSYRFSARTLVVFNDTDEVFLCTTTQTTPRNKAYIRAQADTIGGTFINLTNLIPTTWKGAHIIGQSYEAGDRVTTNANTRIYTARVDTGETPPHADWIQVGPVGNGSNFTLRQGTTAPDNSLGDDGDWYLRTSNGQWYEKVSGSWVSRYTDQIGQAGTGITETQADARYLNEENNLSDLNDAAASRTNLELGTVAIRDTGIAQNNIPILDVNGDVDATVIPIDNTLQIDGSDNLGVADGAITNDKLATNAAGEGKVPIDNTLQFDGSGNLGVEISTVIDLLDEDIRYYSTDTTREDAQQASKGVVFLGTSRYAKRIHSIEWDFEGDGITHNYTTFIVRIDSNDDIDFVYGESETLFNVGTSGTRRFNFDSSGLRIPGNVERLGVFLTRTGSDNTWVTKVYRGQPASDSPRESYPDASVDFPFWRSARFASGRPEPGEHIDNYITNGEIYGYPKIRYTLELEHASLVGDGNISSSHISSGSSADGTVLTADGSGNSAFEDLVVRGVTHIESGATYNNNVISVSTTGNVRGGDGILFAVPSPFGTSATQAISLEINGQANSEQPLHDRNGDALHEADLTVNSVYIAISDANSWDILVLPSGSGDGTTVTANPSGTDGENLTRLSLDGTNYNLLSGSADNETQVASSAIYEAASESVGRIQVTLDKNPLDGDIFSFEIPSDIPITGTLSFVLRTDVGGTNGPQFVFRGQDDVQFTAGDILASRHVLVQRNGSNYIALSPVQEVSGAGLSSSTPSEHGIGQSGAAGTAILASRSDHVHAIPVGIPVATDNENAEGTATTASRSDHVHQNGVFSWGFQIETKIVPELNQNAITDARIVLEDSALTHYLTFLDWTQANLDMISHLPVGAHIGLRQGVTTRILQVEALWDSTNNRYQVINVNTGILSESSSGTDTELLLTAGVGGGTIHTTGSTPPANPVTNQLFTFNVDATGQTLKSDDGTTDITVANEGDTFKYNGTDWVKQWSVGSTSDDTSNAYEALATNITYAFTGSAGAAGAIFKISRALVEADDYGLVIFSQRIGTQETSGREPLPPVLARDIRLLGRTVHPGVGNQIGVTTSVIRLQGSAWDLDYHDSPSSGTWNLHYSGSLVTTLANSATAGSTSLSLNDASDLEAGDTIFIDSETIVITSVSGNNLTVPATTSVHASGASVFLDDKRGFFFGQTRNAQNDVDDLDIILLSSGGVTEGGQESPGTPGVAELTPDLVTVTFYKWVLTTDGKPADPTAHWRFDDEWNGTTPFQGGGWYISRATALDEANNNPAFSQDTWTLWIATEQVRRRIVNDVYSYTNGGYTVTAAWDIQYSIDGSTWTTTEPTDTYHYIRYRDQETGEFGPTIPIGTNVGSNDWQPIRTNDLVYPGGSDEDELQAAYDFGNFSDLLFVAASYRSVTVSDGMGGTMVVGVNGPWHQCIISRGAGWSVANANDGQDNNDEDDGSCFQFTYFATNTGVGLLVWERGDDYIDLGNPPFLQDNAEPPRQMGGHMKIVSTDGDEAHVTKFRFFDFSHDYARININIFARYR